MKTSSILRAMTAPSSSLTGTMKCGILKSNTGGVGYKEATNQLWMKKQTTLLMAFALVQKRFNLHLDTRSCLIFY